MCMTSQGDQTTLGQWISDLQLNNPILGRVPTLFRLDPGPQHLQRGDEEESDHGHQLHEESDKDDPQPGEDTETVLEEEPRRSTVKQ